MMLSLDLFSIFPLLFFLLELDYLVSPKILGIRRARASLFAGRKFDSSVCGILYFGRLVLDAGTLCDIKTNFVMGSFHLLALEQL
jgi:hypothetical protein